MLASIRLSIGGDARVPADERQFADGRIEERSDFFAAERGNYIPRRVFPFAGGVLGCWRVALCSISLRNLGAIADRPDSGAIRNLAAGVDLNAPMFSFFAVQLFDQRIRLDTAGPDESSGCYGFAALYSDRTTRCPGYSGVHSDVDATLFQCGFGVRRQIRSQFLKQTAIRIYQNCANIFPVNCPVFIAALAEKVVQRRHGFYATETAAGNNKRQQCFSPLSILFP
jgi:hypothetical protein